MRTIDTMRTRVDAAGNLADILAAAWDAFEVVRAAADECADRTPELFAAFMFAASAAAQGGDAIGFAPSMPADPGPPLGQVDSRRDGDEVADELAALAVVLASRLQAAVGQARNPGDRQACEHAAQQARYIGELLRPPER